MNVEIFSRQAVMELLERGFPKNTAVISFYSPSREKQETERRVPYGEQCDTVFYCRIPDIDRECLAKYGYTEQTYLSEADEIAAFIYRATREGKSILCQCDYGQSRSAACAAAILQHFERRGIDVFVDYRYYPNQLVYHKIYDALERYRACDEK